jgi:putative phage-type endonuclease
MIEQGTDAWLRERAGKVTASRISDVMSKGRGSAPSATRANYMAQLVAERLTGEPTETFTSAAMQHGTDTEPQARAQYIMRTGQDVQEVGFVAHPTLFMSGASPDGLVGDAGLVEIKCPNTATHIQTLRGKEIDRKYLLQMQWQMICTGREWCDWISFDPRMPDDLAFLCKRIPHDAELAEEITEAVTQFLADLDAMEADLRAMQDAAA